MFRIILSTNTETTAQLMCREKYTEFVQVFTFPNPMCWSWVISDLRLQCCVLK